MKLAAITVQKYRSLTSARKLQLQDQTILVGPNNEGKSNILRALVAGMQLLKGLRQVPVRRPRGPRIITQFDPRHVYDWRRDFPVSLLERHGASAIKCWCPVPNPPTC